jgi:hypothetical protein
MNEMTSRHSRLRRVTVHPYYKMLVLVVTFAFISQWKVLSSHMMSAREFSSLESASTLPLTQEGNPPSSVGAFYKLKLEDSSLPKWMLNYTNWHRQQLEALNSMDLPSWSQQRLLILRCVGEDRCGGTADRLKSLPLFLAMAAKTERLLFLRWTRPFALEEFILPGPLMNWSVPSGLEALLHNATSSRVYFEGKQLQKFLTAAENPSIWLVEGNIQHTGGNVFRRLVYELQQSSSSSNSGNNEDSIILDPPSFFHDMFLSLFTPAASIQAMVQQYMKILNLIPNQFVVAHYRAKYPKEPYRDTGNLTILEETVVNAVRCASSLTTAGLPVYVASDTIEALRAAQHYANQNRQRIVSHLDVPRDGSATILLPAQDPPHLNFAKEEDASAFYSIFLDLFIMSQSRCVSFGAGGFGRFGSLASFNASCRTPHSIKGKRQRCSAQL